MQYLKRSDSFAPTRLPPACLPEALKYITHQSSFKSGGQPVPQDLYTYKNPVFSLSADAIRLGSVVLGLSIFESCGQRKWDRDNGNSGATSIACGHGPRDCRGRAGPPSQWQRCFVIL